MVAERTTSALSPCPAIIDQLDRIPKRIEPSIQKANAGRLAELAGCGIYLRQSYSVRGALRSVNFRVIVALALGA
jgi:hypothetical protein